MNKKLVYGSLPITIVLACTIAYGINQKPNQLFAEECNHVGNHYDGVEPTLRKSGVKEYWVCCLCHNIYTEKPIVGTWEEQGEAKISPTVSDIRYASPKVYEKLDDGTINFGYYPQSNVTDEMLIDELNEKAGDLPTEDNPNLWTSYGYYEYSLSSSEGDMWYIDIDNDADGFNDYRGVYFTGYRVSQAGGSAYYSKHRYSGYSTSIAYWFKYEPINWRILSQDSEKAFLLSNVIIDSQHYSNYTTTLKESKTDYQGNVESVYQNNYKYSFVRSWLNTLFINTTFNATENTIISETTVKNSADTTSTATNPYTCSSTIDKIFLLSYSEAIDSNYGLGTEDNTVRKMKGTDYSIAQGLGSSVTPTEYYPWWLRSPSNANKTSDPKYNLSSYITTSGAYSGDAQVDFTYYGVLPALCINL